MISGKALELQKNSYVLYTERIWSRKISPEIKLGGTPKLLKAFFSKLIFGPNYRWETRGSNSGILSSIALKFGSFIAK